MDDKVCAPFNRAQVEHLNHYQVSGYFHPFTCGDRDHPGHHVHPRMHDVGILIASRTGWYCPDCPYTQNWAWTWMTQSLPEDWKQPSSAV